jgi:hypothetical protein
MMSRKVSVLLSAVVFAVSTLAANAYAADHSATVKSGILGTPMQGAAARTVKIDASTKYVNAEHFETVTIQNQKGQSFTWQFDTLGEMNFPLKRIAPAGFDAGDTWIYVNHPASHRTGG